MMALEPDSGCGTHDWSCGRVQYSQGGFDISSEMYAEEDSDEVAVFSVDGLLLVVVAEEPDGRWSVKSSEVADVVGLLFADREEALRYVSATVEVGAPPNPPIGQETWV